MLAALGRARALLYKPVDDRITNIKQSFSQEIKLGNHAAEANEIFMAGSALFYSLSTLNTPEEQQQFDIIVAGTVIIAMALDDQEQTKDKHIYQRSIGDLLQVNDKLDQSVKPRELDYAPEFSHPFILNIGRLALIDKSPDVPFNGVIPFDFVKKALPEKVFDKYMSAPIVQDEKKSTVGSP